MTTPTSIRRISGPASLMPTPPSRGNGSRPSPSRRRSGVRFLVDNCAGRLPAEWLREQGHDVARTRDRGPDPGDETILWWAVDEGRILVTMDKDFGTLVYRDQLRHAGLIRLPHCTVEQRKALL